MQPQEPLTVALEPSPLECWNDKSTVSALRALAVRLHSTGISLRETAAALETFGVTRSHQTVFQWVHRVAEEIPDPPTFTRAKLSWANQNASRSGDGEAVADRCRRNCRDDRHRTALAVRRN